MLDRRGQPWTDSEQTDIPMLGCGYTESKSLVCIYCLKRRLNWTKTRQLACSFHNFASPALLNRSSLFMYTVRLLTALCLVLFISSLIGTPLSLLDVT